MTQRVCCYPEITWLEDEWSSFLISTDCRYTASNPTPSFCVFRRWVIVSAWQSPLLACFCWFLQKAAWKRSRACMSRYFTHSVCAGLCAVRHSPPLYLLLILYSVCVLSHKNSICQLYLWPDFSKYTDKSLYLEVMEQGNQLVLKPIPFHYQLELIEAHTLCTSVSNYWSCA